MASLYADENVRYPVVATLRAMGHDVLTCQEAGRAEQGIDDPTVLADAHRMGRVLLTQNRDDFKKLHKRGLPHQPAADHRRGRRGRSPGQGSDWLLS